MASRSASTARRTARDRNATTRGKDRNPTMEYIPIRVSDIVRKVNRDWYLPAIQREFEWSTRRIERLFDSILSDFPIGSFLFWNLEERNKDEWPIYEFIREYDEEKPHNMSANMHGITKDITLILDGQQRITSLYIGLKGSYRYFYYRWRKSRLYLNLLKYPSPNDEDPEELTFDFSFRETADSSDVDDELWYQVGKILDFNDAEDAKADMEERLGDLPEEKRKNANRIIGKLHNRIHTTLVGNYYQEKSQDYDKVLQIFVRANSAGKPLDYSDLLLATATAKWETLDARSEIHDFTDSLNEIGTGYNFGKDFVLKACLYLCESLPIQYRVKNFTKTNLLTIESSWDSIKEALACTVRLISRFGFHSKNVVAPLALLPIAFYLLKHGNPKFDQSSDLGESEAQRSIRRWFVFSTLKNAFGGSSDTTLTRLRQILKRSNLRGSFPAIELYKSLDINPSLTDLEIDRILDYQYNERYTYLVLSLLYPDQDWKRAEFHQDHIFPKSEFKRHSLKKRQYGDAMVERYMSSFNTLQNLQLLTDSENTSKGAVPFDEWLKTRDPAFCSRHLIPILPDYGIDHFEEFSKARRELIIDALRQVAR